MRTDSKPWQSTLHRNVIASVLLLSIVAFSRAVQNSGKTHFDKRQQLEDQDVVYTIPKIHEPYSSNRLRHSRDNSVTCEEGIQVTLPTPEFDIELSLKLTKGLITPRATVEIFNGNNFTTAKPVRSSCFYQGKVKDKQHSYAALSEQNGLTGVFMYDGQDYSLEPIGQFNKNSGVDDELSMHVIKKLQQTGHEGMLNDSFILSNDNLLRGRKRRDVAASSHVEKFLEVMVVTDKTVIDFHGDENSELFILALFNMMNLVYSHSSLGTPIHLSLVKIVLLDEDTVKDMWDGDDPRTTLDRFCIWSAINSMRDFEEGHYDFAMYLSRDRMDPAGYAPVTGMCRPDRSCALVKEDGFSTAFVAAHEIGHTIGMSHDGEGTNKCVNEPKRGSIMAPLVMANLNNYFWSPCSKDEIEAIVSSLYCLNDDPFDIKWSELDIPLGQNWELDDQCEKDFGKGHKLCSRLTHSFNPCEQLWCSTPENRYLCKTKRAPPLPGSRCGKGRWCLNSQCVVANPNDPIWSENSADNHLRLSSVDGEWSNWSSWSKCSTTCGKGIKSRTRRCDNPKPSLGGKDCQGESYELRLCDLPEQMRLVCKRFSNLSFSVRRTCMKHQVYYRHCDKEIDDTRAEQCSKYNKHGRTYVPYQPDEVEDQCLLNCHTEENGTPLYGKIQALDGTFCSYDDRHTMCYAGQCIPLGCDGKFGSQQAEDRCGVCQGDNSNCTTRKEYYNEKIGEGEQLLVRLYPGTRHLSIRKPDDAFQLIIRNVKSNESLLGEEVKGRYTTIDNGVLWKFTNNRTQLLEVTGPLQTEYDILIRSPYSGLRATMSVTFTEPLTVKRLGSLGSRSGELQYEHQNQADVIRPKTIDSTKKYIWLRTGWSNCSHNCGPGMQLEELSCWNTRLNRTVPEFLCRGETRPVPNRQDCLVKECTIVYRWVTSDWTGCPEDICHLTEEFTQKRWAFCVKDSTQVGANWERVEDGECNAEDKPGLEQLCDRTDCATSSYWRTGPWTHCSVTCGVGVQHRDVQCVPLETHRLVLNVVCLDQKPTAAEICSRAPCEDDEEDSNRIGDTTTADVLTSSVEEDEPHDFITTQAHYHPIGGESEEVASESAVDITTTEYTVPHLTGVKVQPMGNTNNITLPMTATPTTKDVSPLASITTSKHGQQYVTPGIKIKSTPLQNRIVTAKWTVQSDVIDTTTEPTTDESTSYIITTEESYLSTVYRDVTHSTPHTMSAISSTKEIATDTLYEQNIERTEATSTRPITMTATNEPMTKLPPTTWQTTHRAEDVTSSIFLPITSAEESTNIDTIQLDTTVSTASTWDSSATASEKPEITEGNFTYHTTTVSAATSSFASNAGDIDDTTNPFNTVRGVDSPTMTSTTSSLSTRIGASSSDTSTISNKRVITTTFSNNIPDGDTIEEEQLNHRDSIHSVKQCGGDSSSICYMMSESRCGLLLFKRLCCKTCMNFL